MISLETISKITAQVKSRALSALQTLSNQAAAFHDKWGELTPRIALLSNFAQFKTGKVGDEERMDDDSYSLACQLASNEQELVFNESASTVDKLSFEYDGQDIIVKYNGNESFIVHDDQFIEYTNAPAYGGLSTLDNVVKRNSKKAGMYYALADIAETASQSDWTANTNLSGGLYAKVNQYHDILGVFVTDLISSISRGPTALIQTITGLVTNIKQQLDNNDLSSLMNSTNIVLNNFSWGIVAQSIGTVITAIGTVVMAVSRVAAAIIAAAGLILSIIGRIVVSATTAFDDTQYKVKAGADVMHAFSFVVDQGQDSLPGVASYMREHGWETMTVVCPFQGSVYFMYLEEFDSATNNVIHYEQHLSSDIDLSGLVSEMRIHGDANAWVPFIRVPNYTTGGSKACGLACLPSYNGTDPTHGNFIFLPFCILNAYGINTTTKPRVALRTFFNPEDFLKPSDFNILDSLKQWYDNELKNFFDIRLCSSLILFCAYKMGGFWASWNKMPDSIAIGDLMGYRIYGSVASDMNSIAVLLNGLYLQAWACFADMGNIATYTNRLRSEFGLTDNQRDTMLSALQTVFNQLNYKTAIPDHTIYAEVVKIDKADGGGIRMTPIGYSDHSLTPDMCQDIAAPCISQMFSYNYDDLSFRAGQWINSFAVDLPTLTFTGFIAGLIVDGLLLAVTAAITVVAVVGWVKLRNKASQLQAKAEGAWYKYEDDPSNQNWKEYKRARFKYNVLAVCTGGTTLGLGLYDEGSSTDVVSDLKGYVATDDVQTNVNSLSDIIRILKG